MEKMTLREITSINKNIIDYATNLNKMFAEYDLLAGENILSEDDIKSCVVDGKGKSSSVSVTYLEKCYEMKKMAYFKFLVRSIKKAPKRIKQMTISNTYNSGDVDTFIPSREEMKKIKKAEKNHKVEVLENGTIGYMTFPKNVKEVKLKALAERWTPHNPKVTYFYE